MLTLLRPQSLPGSGLVRSPRAGDQILVIDPLHRFIYGAGIRGSEIHQYKIAADDTLIEMNPLTVTIGDAAGSVQTSGMVMGPGGTEVFVSSTLGVHAFSVGSDGQLHKLGPPVGPANGPGPGCIAISPGGGLIATCAGQAIDLYTVTQNGGVQFLASSAALMDADGDFGPFTLAFDSDTTLIAVGSGHLSKFGINNGAVDAKAVSTGPADAADMWDLSVQAGTAFAVAGDLIVPAPPGGGTNDHLSVYDISTGLGAPSKSDTGRGPGHVLALAFNLQTGTPTVPSPLVYVTNSRDNNVAQCVPIGTSPCPTVGLAQSDIHAQGITGFLGSPGN